MKLITLVAGQCCSIKCCGSLRVKLYTGNVEIAGAPLLPNTVVTFVLNQRPLHLYTLEGCVIGVQLDGLESSSTLSAEVCKLSMASLLKLIKKGFDAPNSVNAAGLAASSTKNGVRIVVAGKKGTGKFLAASTITNALNRTKSSEGTIFCDLTTELGGQFSRLGCVGCIETHPDVPLWQGLQWSAYTASVSFFNGITSIVTAGDLPQFLATASSACESATWMSQNKSDSPIVYVLPNFDESTVSQETFFRATMELIKPTHVVFTGEEDVGQHALGRLLPSAKLAYCGSLVTATEMAAEADLSTEVSDYFAGNSFNPLGASLLTVPLSSIQFAKLQSSPPNAVTAEPFDITQEVNTTLRGALCAVSHAAELAEIPYANIAGFIVIVDIFSERDEVEILSPSSDAFLPSKFLIISGMNIDSSQCERLLQ